MSNLVKQLLLSNAYWVINKQIVKTIGLEPAFLLGVFAEGETVLADDDGWFYQTSAKITELTGMSNHKQANAINKLIELGVLMQENRDVPCKRYFKINYDNIEKLVFKNFENWNLKNLKTSFQKISNNKESNIKNLDKEINDVDDTFTAEALTYYEYNIGLLNSVLAENIKDLTAEVGIVAFKKAVDKSILSNKRNFFYIQKVARGIAAGDDWDNKQSKGNDDVWGNALNELEKEGLYDTAN